MNGNSILQDDNTYCYLCRMSYGIEPLDKHHIFNGADRNKSERYGLYVYLHHNKCHIFGRNSVHQNIVVRNKLQAEAQQKAMEHYKWSKQDFMDIFGRNYI